MINLIKLWLWTYLDDLLMYKAINILCGQFEYFVLFYITFPYKQIVLVENYCEYVRFNDMNLWQTVRNEVVKSGD